MADPDRPIPITDELELEVDARRLAGDGGPIPLHEKPFLLLRALLERRGRVVSREELFDRIWPETEHLDFDANLNATVLKLRKALGEPPGEPRWIETIPGRGYRLRELSGAEEATAGEPRWRHPGRTIGVASFVALLVLAGPLFWRSFRALILPVTPEASEAAEIPTLRLGVMRFERTALDSEHEPTLARVGEGILSALANRLRGRVDVVGPRSTLPFEDDPFPRLDDLESELELDHVLNARWLRDGERTGLLVELIRLSDGSHPWVDLFALEDGDPSRIERETVEGVVRVLGEEARGTGQPEERRLSE